MDRHVDFSPKDYCAPRTNSPKTFITLAYAGVRDLRLNLNEKGRRLYTI